MARRSDSPGSESRARAHKDSPGTWETSPSLGRSPATGPEPEDPAGEAHLPNLRAPGCTESAKREGNEARGDGRRGVKASRSTDTGGELHRRDPQEERTRQAAEP